MILLTTLLACSAEDDVGNSHPPDAGTSGGAGSAGAGGSTGGAGGATAGTGGTQPDGGAGAGGTAGSGGIGGGAGTAGGSGAAGTGGGGGASGAAGAGGQPVLPWLGGVNLAGAEFGESNLPGDFGTHYTYPTHEEVDYFVGKGMNVFRLPFRWERLQLTLESPFDPVELGRLDDFVAYASGHGAWIILDPHNYA